MITSNRILHKSDLPSRTTSKRMCQISKTKVRKKYSSKRSVLFRFIWFSFFPSSLSLAFYLTLRLSALINDNSFVLNSLLRESTMVAMQCTFGKPFFKIRPSAGLFWKYAGWYNISHSILWKILRSSTNDFDQLISVQRKNVIGPFLLFSFFFYFFLPSLGYLSNLNGAFPPFFALLSHFFGTMWYTKCTTQFV